MAEKKGDKKKVEQRSLSISQIRATKDDDGKMNVRGYAIVYEQWAPDGYGGREMVARGAAKKTLKEQENIMALWNHNTDIVLGRTGNKTLRLKEDAHGLAIDLDLPDTTMGRDAFISIERGDVDKMSFGFGIIKSSEAENPDDKSKIDFTIEEIRLFEVSPVTFPFYTGTELGVRDAMEKAGANAELITRTLENLNSNEPAEPPAEGHSQENIKEPPAEGHSEEKKDKEEERSAGEPVREPVAVPKDDHSTETNEEEETRTVPPEIDAETSTGELQPASKTLIKMQKMSEEQLRRQLDARFKLI